MEANHFYNTNNNSYINNSNTKNTQTAKRNRHNFELFNETSSQENLNTKLSKNEKKQKFNDLDTRIKKSNTMLRTDSKNEKQESKVEWINVLQTSQKSYISQLKLVDKLYQDLKKYYDETNGLLINRINMLEANHKLVENSNQFLENELKIIQNSNESLKKELEITQISNRCLVELIKNHAPSIENAVNATYASQGITEKYVLNIEPLLVHPKNNVNPNTNSSIE